MEKLTSAALTPTVTEHIHHFRVQKNLVGHALVAALWQARVILVSSFGTLGVERC